jgi:hypothetical protein
MLPIPANDHKKPINYRPLWILATAAILLQWIPSFSLASEILSSSAPLLTQQEAAPPPAVKQLEVVARKRKAFGEILEALGKGDIVRIIPYPPSYDKGID